LAEDPKEAFTLNLLGKVHAAVRDFGPAEAAFKEAIDLEPMWPELYNNLASVYILQGKTGEAARKYREALASDPKSPSAYMALGFIHQEQKDYREAVRIYEQGVAAVPNFWGAYNNLAFLLAEFGGTEADYRRALDFARKAQRLQPERLSIADTVGWVYYKMGNIEQALAVFSDLLARAPEDPVLNYHAGIVLFKAGRKEEAQEKLQAALAENKPFFGRDEAEKTLAEIKGRI
jgi:tetratricopeptide (TPR) repeat protein